MLEPSIKQYNALMKLGAIPMSEEKDGKRVPMLDKYGQQILDDNTVEIGYGGGAGGGKILEDDGVILTQFGRKKGKDLVVGDKVSNPDGGIQRIIGLTQRMTLPKWRVSFSDGTHTDVAEGHLWNARKARRGRQIKGKMTCGLDSAEVIETKGLKDWITRGYKPLIPVCNEQSLCYVSKEKNKIDPYLLGALLGDGCFTGSCVNTTLTCADEDADHRLKAIGKTDITIRKSCGKTSLAFVGERNIQLNKKLKDYNLYGKYSDTKFIPKQYKYGNIKDRYQIVRGLMDSDGHKGENKRASYYYSTSKQMAEDVMFILRSLGAVVTITDRIGKYKKDGITHECKKVYTLYIKHREPDLLFGMKRKQKNLGYKEINKQVTSVEQLDENITGRCITVSNPNGLYITNDFIVTHNSYIGCYRITMMCQKYAGTRWFIAREEQKKLRESTLLTLFQVLREQGLRVDNEGFHFNNVSGTVTFPNGSTIVIVGLAFEPSDPMFTRFGSTEYTGGFIDEANECVYKGYEIILSRIRYKLESFCPYCAADMDHSDKIGEETIKNPNAKGKDDEFIERNIYKCNNCGRQNHGLSPKLLSTFNPSKGWVYDKFYRPYKDGKLPNNVTFIPALVTDNKFIPKAYINSLRAMDDKVTRERLLHGNFDYDDTPGRLFDYDELQEVFNRPTMNQELKLKYDSDPDYRVDVDTLGKCHQTGYDYRISCDVARHGRDLAVIMVWLGLSVVEMYVYYYSDITELQSRITILWDKYNIGPRETIVDEDGVGGGLVDSLKCRGFINRAPAIQPKKAKKSPLDRVNYYTIKDQCYFELAKQINNITIDIEHIYVFGNSISHKKKTLDVLTPEQIKKRIIEELDVIVEVDIDKDGPKKIINKAEIKMKLKRSPDFGDCLMFRMYWEIKRSTRVFVYNG